jgi:hypothetical protein
MERGIPFFSSAEDHFKAVAETITTLRDNNSNKELAQFLEPCYTRAKNDPLFCFSEDTGPIIRRMLQYRGLSHAEDKEIDLISTFGKPSYTLPYLIFCSPMFCVLFNYNNNVVNGYVITVRINGDFIFAPVIDYEFGVRANYTKYCLGGKFFGGLQQVACIPYEKSSGLTETAMQFVCIGLHYIDLPKHFIIVETPEIVKEGKVPRKKIPNAQQRDRYILLDPEAAKKIYVSRTDKPQEGTHASPIPHLRRAHSKVLRSDRYAASGKQGQIVYIRPTWVGDVDWECGQTKYKVLVRRGSKQGQA